MRTKTILGAVFAASLLSLGAAAQAQYTAIVSVAPPPPRHEVIPSPRTGYVWDAGHYEYRGNQYVWVDGHWVAARQGYDFQERRWVQRGNGEWMLVGGNWERRGAYGDRDRDGVPNRYDADNRRFGPYGDLDHDGIQNRNDRDRDGDGVPNRHDRFPDNPRRS